MSVPLYKPEADRPAAKKAFVRALQYLNEKSGSTRSTLTHGLSVDCPAVKSGAATSCPGHSMDADDLELCGEVRAVAVTLSIPPRRLALAIMALRRKHERSTYETRAETLLTASSYLQREK